MAGLNVGTVPNLWSLYTRVCMPDEGIMRSQRIHSVTAKTGHEGGDWAEGDHNGTGAGLD